MPQGWDGVETIAQLWAADPSLQIVICTAYSDYSWEQILQRLGKRANLAVLKKPFDNIEVIQLCETLAQKWSLRRQLLARGPVTAEEASRS
jgi:DNA-binding LytR/AlgR family response regulator